MLTENLTEHALRRAKETKQQANKLLLEVPVNQGPGYDFTLYNKLISQVMELENQARSWEELA